MFHAISSMLACLADRATGYRLSRDRDLAAAYGWQVYRVAPGVYRYRDPRFDQRKALAGAKGR